MADSSEAQIKKLRAEAAKYRTAYAPFRDAVENFSEEEVKFMLDVLTKLGGDDTQAEGAMELRELSRRVLKEDFYEGLDIEAPEPSQEDEKEEEEMVSKDELKALLEEDRKLTKKEQAEARKAEKEQADKDARIEAVFQAVEAEGFKRGTEGFMTMLALAETAENLGKEISFAELAPKVTGLLGEEGAEAPAEEDAAPEPKEEGRHPKTAKKGTAGAAAEEEGDWIEEAKAEGKNLWDVAQERAEARMDG